PVPGEPAGGDLKGEPERLGDPAERVQVCAAQSAETAAEHRGCGEQPAGLQPAPREVLLDGGADGPGLVALQYLAAGEGQAGVGQERDGLQIASLDQLREGPREQVVARGGRNELAV